MTSVRDQLPEHIVSNDEFVTVIEDAIRLELNVANSATDSAADVSNNIEVTEFEGTVNFGLREVDSIDWWTQ